MQSKRDAVLLLKKQNFTVSNISKTVGLSRKGVYGILHRYESTGKTQPRSRSGRPRTISTPANINKLRLRIRRNPHQSLRKVAKEIRVSKTTLHRIAKNRLKVHAFKFRRGQHLSDDAKKTRLKRCRKLLVRVAGEKLQNVVFSDENFFVLNKPTIVKMTGYILRTSPQLILAKKWYPEVRGENP